MIDKTAMISRYLAEVMAVKLAELSPMEKVSFISATKNMTKLSAIDKLADDYLRKHEKRYSVGRKAEKWILFGKEDEEEPQLTPWIRLTKEAEPDSHFVKICKADEEQRIVYGIVLEPHEVDGQGDWETPEQIEKACHDYMREYRKQGSTIYLQHEREAEDVDAVESYIAPADFTMGEGTAKKGSWIMACYVGDDEAWRKVKEGAYSGYSIGGIGERL